MTLILLIQVFSTLFMVGLIWFVQIVHYPLFSEIGVSAFQRYEMKHQRLTTWVVAPVMIVELITSVALLKVLSSELLSAAWIGVALLAVTWLVTGTLSVPAHKSLTVEFSTAAYRKLVVTNWIRTVAWTVRGVIVLSITYRCLA